MTKYYLQEKNNKHIITELNNEIKLLKEEKNDSFRLMTTHKETTNTQDNSYAYTLKNNFYIEDEVQTMLGYKHYNGAEPLMSLPYSDTLQINSGYPSDVKVISTVRNKDNEHWALVEFYEHSSTRKNNYGFIKVKYIEEAVGINDISTLDIPIYIEGIKKGDLLQKAIGILGEDYAQTRGFDGGVIHYGDLEIGEHTIFFEKGLDILYDVKTNIIWGFRIDDIGYNTSEGYGVGSNAMMAIQYYNALYPMNGDVNFENDIEEYHLFPGTTIGNWSFDVGNGYILKFEIDTEKLTKDSKITCIELKPSWNYYV